jgi:hypothetical protein
MTGKNTFHVFYKIPKRRAVKISADQAFILRSAAKAKQKDHAAKPSTFIIA